jgi:hypothetical protein
MNGGINFHSRFGGLKVRVLSGCEVYSNVYVLDRAWYELPINYTSDSLSVHKKLHIVQEHTLLRDENCTFLGYYAVNSGHSVRMFRDNICPFFKGQESKKGMDSSPLKMGTIGCLDTSVRNYHYSLRNSSEERISHLRRGGSLKSLTLSDVAGFTCG